jgi:hypothetical protein
MASQWQDVRNMEHTYSTDMRDFMNSRGEQADLTPEAAKLVKFFAVVILLALRGGKGKSAFVVPCRFNPKRRRCTGTIKASLSATDEVLWECPLCGDTGVIRNWRNSPWDITQWDLKEMAKLFLEEPPRRSTCKVLPPGSPIPVLLSQLDVEMLRKHAFAGKTLGPVPMGKKGIRVNLTLKQIENLVIALGCHEGETLDPKINAHLNKVALKLIHAMEQYEQRRDSLIF